MAIAARATTALAVVLCADFVHGVRPVATAVLLPAVAAHRQFLDMLPHGHTFYEQWPALGHVAPLPNEYQPSAVTFPRNPFGLDFATNGFKWDRTLCLKDSDGDGVSNGKELGDPQCEWRVGMAPPSVPTATLSHPGLKGVRMNELKAWWQLHKNASLAGTEQLETFVGVLAWELFFYHYILAPALIVAALVMAFLRVPGAHAPSFLGVCVCTYLVCHVGILVGAHRCLSHHACQFTDSGKALFAFLTSIAAQGPARSWAFLHRVHHRFCEQELDIHSPDPQDFGYGFFWAQGLFYTSEQMLAQMNTHNFHYVAPEMENEAAMIADGWPAEMVLPGQMIARHVHILVSFAILAFGYASLRQAYRAGYLRRCLSSRSPARVSAMDDEGRDGEAGGTPTVRSCCAAFCHSFVFSFNAVALYFWLPMVLSMQITMLVNSAVHIWGDEPYEDAMSQVNPLGPTTSPVHSSALIAP